MTQIDKTLDKKRNAYCTHDADDNVMIEHEFDVPMTRRQITWLSGPFFSGSATEPLVTNITINTEWEGESYFTF